MCRPNFCCLNIWAESKSSEIQHTVMTVLTEFLLCLHFRISTKDVDTEQPTHTIHPVGCGMGMPHVPILQHWHPNPNSKPNTNHSGVGRFRYRTTSVHTLSVQSVSVHTKYRHSPLRYTDVNFSTSMFNTKIRWF